MGKTTNPQDRVPIHVPNIFDSFYLTCPSQSVTAHPTTNLRLSSSVKEPPILSCNASPNAVVPQLPTVTLTVTSLSMASCDDSDFSLLGDDTHHHHPHQPNPNPHPQLYAPHRFPTTSTPIHVPHQPILTPVATGSGTGEEEGQAEREDEEGEENDGSTSAFPNADPFTESSDPFGNNEPPVRSGKRTDRDDHNNNNNSSGPYGYKRARASGGGGGGGGGGGEYRKDREEWSDVAIGSLLEAYLEKFTQLNRGNLRGRDWEEVAAAVSERCEKTVEQCKNKVDNLKKRYKLERQRMSNGGISASHWPWFKKMEEIVGNSPPAKVAGAASGGDEDTKGGCAGGAASSATLVKHSKRYAATTATPVGQTNNVKFKSMSNIRWRRVVFKISGVALAGTGPNNVDPKVIMLIAREVAMACRLGVEVAIVVGGRNFFCGDTWVTETGSHRRTAYQIGMMASVMNSILLQSALEKMNVQSRLQTAFVMHEVAEPYSKQRAIRHLEKGRVVIFGGIGSGIGNPLFSTDTAAALQASEIDAEAFVKGTNVDGVYDCHSQDNNVTFEHITFRDLVSRGATLMDMMAVTCCEENGIPVVVFNLLEPGNISKALCGEQVGTLIDQSGRIC